MATVDLRPGDTLNIIWNSVQETPLGVQEVESSFSFSYDELMSKLRANSTNGKSKRSGSNGARFSRIVALSSNALKKGKWSTGADIDRSEVFEKLIQKFNELESDEYSNITSNARNTIVKLYEDDELLSFAQKAELHQLVEVVNPSTH